LARLAGEPLAGPLQRFAVVLQAHDVVGHQLEYRRMQPRVREPLDLVLEVPRIELACPGLLEVAQLVFAREISAREILVERLAVAAARKRRVRLIADAALDADLIDGGGDLMPRRAGRQGAAP